MSILSDDSIPGCAAGTPPSFADFADFAFPDAIPLPPPAKRATSARSAFSFALSSAGNSDSAAADDEFTDTWDKPSPNLKPTAAPAPDASDLLYHLVPPASGSTLLGRRACPDSLFDLDWPRSSPTSPMEAHPASLSPASASAETPPAGSAQLPPLSPASASAETPPAGSAQLPLQALAAAASRIAAHRAQQVAAASFPALRPEAVRATALSAATHALSAAGLPDVADLPVQAGPPDVADLPVQAPLRRQRASLRTVPATRRRDGGMAEKPPLRVTATPFDVISAPAIHEVVIAATPTKPSQAEDVIEVTAPTFVADTSAAATATGSMSPASRKRARRAMAQPRLVREEIPTHVDTSSVVSKTGGPERLAALKKWLEKRKTRVWGGRPKYAVRSEIARKRARANGRFADTGNMKWRCVHEE